jgi:hypothetical protein
MTQNGFEQSAQNPQQDAITLFGHNPADILDLFKNLGLAAQGYFILGRILPHKAHYVGADGQNVDPIGADSELYAATFIRNFKS